MNNGQIRNILWDWNGTLLDDVDICIECMNVLLSKRSMEAVTVGRYREIFTFPIRHYLTGLGFDFTREPFEVPADEFVVLYNDKFREAGLFGQVRDSLSRFRELGFRQYILSAQEQTLLDRLIDHYGLREFFETVSGTGDNYAHSKVETGFRLMQEHGLDRSETVMIGDTLHDHEVARAIGVDCILISHGHQSTERLMTAGVPVVHDFSEIAGYITGKDHSFNSRD